ncbi:MAG: phosphotransferase [Alphaproteobacteria bacterium]|nr:phosphotransferase [Alphaproteobacteria bacterium]
MTEIKNLNHGRETYAVDYGEKFVLKRPLPVFNDEQKQKWLEKQHKTKECIDAIRSVNHTVYNVPNMEFINDDEYQILEERAQGQKLTRDLYLTLSTRQQHEIINSIGTFLVDMNELKEAYPEKNHKITSEFKFDSLMNFVNNRMNKWFKKNEILQMKRFCEQIDSFTYDTYMAWSHGDLNSGNVYYDTKTSTLSFIDFAEAGYHLIYADIFAPLQTDLRIEKRVYEKYIEYHQPALWRMTSLRNQKMQEIMKYRAESVLLKRFLKASQDLRTNPQSEKGVRNTAEKVKFMREQMAAILTLEQKFAKK